MRLALIAARARLAAFDHGILCTVHAGRGAELRWQGDAGAGRASALTIRRVGIDITPPAARIAPNQGMREWHSSRRYGACCLLVGLG